MATEFEANSYAVLMTITTPGIVNPKVRERILTFLDTAPADVKAKGRNYYVEYTSNWR